MRRRGKPAAGELWEEFFLAIKLIHRRDEPARGLWHVEHKDQDEHATEDQDENEVGLSPR